MFKKVLWVLGGILLLAQFVRPDRETPALNAALDFQRVSNPPADVQAILKNACYDCHSFETKYPWYAHIAPFSWFLANHIREGREHLNFSVYGQMTAADRAEALGEAAEAVREGEMPLPSYTWFGLHPEAKLSADQQNLLLRWLEANGGEGGDSGAEGAGDDD